MKKSLVITVGTGVGKATNSLASGIAYSIKTHHPDKVIFVVTEGSERDTLPKVVKKAKLEECDIRRIRNMDDIEAIYADVKNVLSDLAREGFSPEDMVVDYTSGTKAMSAGAAMAAIDFGVEVLSYVAGKREGGIVVPGTEKPVLIRPYKVVIESQLKTLVQLFNVYQFDACLRILQQLREKTSESEIQERLQHYEKICKAYSAWDKFNHVEAFGALREIEDYSQNKEFLGKLLNEKEKEPFRIADLLNNSRRRSEEGKYDDAVARLYRTVELIAQYRLRVKFRIDSSNVELDKIHLYLQDKYEKMRDEKGKIRLGLIKNYELLKDMDDELGRRFSENKKLQGLLNKRNESILAHGLSSVSKEIYEGLYPIVLDFAETTVPEIGGLMEKSKFPKFGEFTNFT